MIIDAEFLYKLFIIITEYNEHSDETKIIPYTFCQ